MKNFLKYFSLVLFCSFFMLLLVSKPASANYDPEKNVVNISVNKNEVKITVRYQRGIDRGQSVYTWCERDNENASECNSNLNALELGEVNYIDIGGDNKEYFSQGDANYADNNITTVTFTVTKDKDPFLKYINTDMNSSSYKVAEKHYSIVVTHVFCAVRNEGYNSCQFSDETNVTTVLKVKGNDLIDGRTTGGTGDSTDDIDDEGLKSMMDRIYDIVHRTVMPIIWSVLGLFLVIKGALLGVQIVKSADEPQIRQEKVGSLKWLVIGVAIAYASSFLVDIVVGFFSNVFK